MDFPSNEICDETITKNGLLYNTSKDIVMYLRNQTKHKKFFTNVS